jgi:ribonuclease VapC
VTAIVVVDSSVIVAVFRDESDAADLLGRAMTYERRVISASTWLECAMVCAGKIEQGGGERFDRIVGALGLEIVAFSSAQAALAREAFKRYGKGRQARASLNFGDCFAYALAKDLGAPLLFKGTDFAQTDIPAA